MKKNRWLKVGVIITCLILGVYKIYPQKTNIPSQWPEIDKWLEWKISTNLSERQRAVITYLQTTAVIFNEAFYTKCVYPNSEYGYPDINKAIDIVKEAIAEIEKIPPPEECIRYKELCIENLKCTLKYHQLRLEYGDATEEFNKKHHEYELAFSESEVGPAKFAEYFACMKKVGLFDNIEEEMKALGFR